MTNILAELALATNVLMALTTSHTGFVFDAREIPLAQDGRISTPIETVCIVTNVAVTDNAQQAHRMSARLGYTISCAVLGCKDNHDFVPAAPATERTETTDIVEIRTLRFTWNGIAQELKQERVLSRKVKKLVLKSNWEER